MNNMSSTPLQSLSDLIESKKKIEKLYRNCFEAENFIFHPPEPLNSKCDKTTLFIGSTISTFKRYLNNEGEQRVASFYTVQDCIRTHNSNNIISASIFPKWSSFFSSVGAVCPPERTKNLINAAINFVKHACVLTNAQFKINISRKDGDLISVLDDVGARDHLEFDTHQSSYYCHTFGMPGVSGRNCNISISQGGGEYMDIGNLIIIEESSAQIAAEAAFGLETVSSRLLGYDSSIYALSTALNFSEFSKDTLYVVDAIVASVAILKCGVRPVADNKGRVLRRYLQGLSAARTKAAISLTDIIAAAEAFEKEQYKTDSASKYMSTYLKTYESLAATLDGALLNAAMSRTI